MLSHHSLELLRLTPQVLDLADWSPLARYHPPSGAGRPPGTPWTKRDRDLRLCLHADTTRQCSTFAPQTIQHDADLLFRRMPCAGCTPDVLHDPLRRRFCRMHGFLSHLHSLMVTMEPESSVPQAAMFVSQALMSDRPCGARGKLRQHGSQPLSQSTAATEPARQAISRPIRGTNHRLYAGESSACASIHTLGLLVASWWPCCTSPLPDASASRLSSRISLQAGH